MAILYAVDHWRSYLQAGEFIIKTDQRSLVHLEEQRITMIWQQKAFTKLLGLNYRICYKRGEENRAADALSRREHTNDEAILSLSECKPTWLKEVVQGYAADPHAQQLLGELAISQQKGPFSLHKGLLRYHQRIWLGSNKLLQQRVISALHDSVLGGHSGYPVTYARIKKQFAWPRMEEEIKQYVRTCSICQQSKPDRSRYPGLLQPLPTPDVVWHVVSLDFIDGLPLSSKFNCILVVVDKLTRYAHFIPLAHPFTAQIVAQSYMDHIFKLHGMPNAIISDRDKIFTSVFWQQLFRLSGTQLQLITSYHPQTDGQTERVNQCLETYLRCFSHACPKQWSKWLSLAEYWYNTSTHSTLGKTPFEVMYGREPRQLGLIITDVSPVPDVQVWLDERQVMMDLLQQHLNRAQRKMKLQADKKRSERSFEVGDRAYLKLQPYVQTSVSRRANHKLSFKYYGAYVILARIGAVAYKLDLPEDSKIHPVFHASQLKPAHQRVDQVQTDLPPNVSLFQVPLKVLDYRWHKTANGMSHQGLILWTNSVPEAATWENLHDLHHRFPQAPAWVPIQVLRTRWRPTPTKPAKQGLILWSYSSVNSANWRTLIHCAEDFPKRRLGDKPFLKEGGLSATILTMSYTLEDQLLEQN